MRETESTATVPSPFLLGYDFGYIEACQLQDGGEQIYTMDRHVALGTGLNARSADRHGNAGAALIGRALAASPPGDVHVVDEFALGAEHPCAVVAEVDDVGVRILLVDHIEHLADMVSIELVIARMSASEEQLPTIRRSELPATGFHLFDGCLVQQFDVRHRPSDSDSAYP